jgi:glyoxylase-like metal-dependent hydrolase (beta-lactamase superfamily II)/rhodanese-related sulfurtransferase
VLFRQFVDEDLGCASYLIGDGDSAVLVDPSFDIDQYLAAGVRIERVLETHTHADHVSGHGRLALEHGIPTSIHVLAEAEYPHDALTDGDEIRVGGITIRVLHTPGHRPEHCAFVVDDKLVLTGDSLFVGDTARPDLAVAAVEGAQDLFQSLQKIAALGDSVEVYPGHVAGSLCGGNMSPERSSTIGHERETNDALDFRDIQDFVMLAASVSTPKPPTTEQVVGLNRGPWVALPTEPSELPVAGDATVLDVRPFDAYAAGHVPGAINVPVSGSAFGTKAAFVLLAGESFVIHARTEAEALEAARGLWKVGVLDIAGYVLQAQADEQLSTIETEELRRLVDESAVQVVDVREASERDEGYIPGSRNIPYRLIRKLGADALDADKPVVTICESGPRAMIAASLLRREGFDVRPVVNGGTSTYTGETVGFRRCGGV